MSDRRARSGREPETALPDGVVTFLFTDIEGSTRLLADHRDAMGPAMARHHEILAAAIEDKGGVVFETVGDAVYAAFTKPLDALVAAVDIQRALGREPWGDIGDVRVRIALHTGEAEVRGRHYYGAALFECARVQALAHGGQTLTSPVTAALVAGSWADGVVLRSLGEHRLKDIDAPMEVFQVDAAGLASDFPPLRSRVEAPTNLPHSTTSFVGRTAELARIDELLDGHRLVTALGPGGSGKTRLAIEAARHRLQHYPDGVWLVELAPLTSPDLVLAELADTWGLRAGEGVTLQDVVTRYLRTRSLLVVLDNCEHVREAAAKMLGLILRVAPSVSVLATSRESLGLPGEVEFRVPALPLPHGGEVRSNDAARLFLDRARAASPDFELTTTDEAALVRVCARVEGMPLALELAAARMRTLSLPALADRLDGSIGALGAGPKTALPHQRSLWATLDWSYELLEDQERMFLRRLSVFAGSFDVAAVEACVGEKPAGGSVLDALDSLFDKSLTVVVPGPAVRFRLLEPIRQYASERLEQAGEAEVARSAHARYYVSFVHDAAARTRGPDQMAWERRIDLEYDNIRAALAHLLASGGVGSYLGLGFDLFGYWMHLGLQVEGAATLAAGLEQADAATDTTVQLKAWFAGAMLLAEITDASGIEYARSGLASARATKDPNAIGRLELALGAAIRHATNDPEYLEHLLEARRLLEADPEPRWWEPAWERAFIELVLGAYLPPDDDRQADHLRTAIEGFAALGDRAMHAAALYETVSLWGRADDAWVIDNLYRSVEMLDSLRAPYQHGHALALLGTILLLQGEYGAAAPQLAEASVELIEMGDLNCWAAACRRLASAEVGRGTPQAARQPLADAIEAIPQLPMPEVDIPRSLDAAVEVLLASGEEEAAAVVFGRARATPFEVDTVLPRDEVLDELQQTLESKLGSTTLRTLMAEGAATEPDEALARIVDMLRSH